MTDILDRLREEVRFGRHLAANRQAETRDLHTQAAAEVERLRAALREMLDDAVEYCRINNLHNDDGGPATNHAMRMAREALGTAKDE